MPYYEYVCDDCSTKFEIKRRLAEIDDAASCPQCNSTRTARQVSLVMAFSHGEGGSVSALGGGGGCGSCGGGTCGSCGVSHSHN
jgi:putative FmdB family regulatory protein